MGTYLAFMTRTNDGPSITFYNGKLSVSKYSSHAEEISTQRFHDEADFGSNDITGHTMNLWLDP